MKIQILGVVENVEKYEGKSGLGANIMLSNLDAETKKRSFLSFGCKDAIQIANFERLLQEEVTVVIELNQNNFGLRFGEIFLIEPSTQD